MSKAEERALEAYPKKDSKVWTSKFGSFEFDGNYDGRKAYQEGYEQAEKDIIALIESRISEIIGDAQPKPVLRAKLQELIRRIKR